LSSSKVLREVESLWRWAGGQVVEVIHDGRPIPMAVAARPSGRRKGAFATASPDARWRLGSHPKRGVPLVQGWLAPRMVAKPVTRRRSPLSLSSALRSRRPIRPPSWWFAPGFRRTSSHLRCLSGRRGEEGAPQRPIAAASCRRLGASSPAADIDHWYLLAAKLRK